jgi:DNA uptake protein ComE-like DNA-binding protein
MGRETNPRASEWLPAELLRPEPEEPVAANGQRRSAEPDRPAAAAGASHDPGLRNVKKSSLRRKNPNVDWVLVEGTNGSAPAEKPLVGAPPRLVEPTISPSAPRRPETRIDLNQARFDQLCGLGLAPHQAAGLIGRREQRGGFESVQDLEELDGKYGLVPEKIEVLKRAVAV